MYTGIKLKNELINKWVFILIIVSFTFSFALNIFGKSLETPTSFKVNIVDEDGSKLSYKTVESIGEFNGVEITDKEADIKYIIKKGFEENFVKGEFNGLIEVKKTSFKQGVSLLNDRIATKLVSDYIYLNLYDRIRLEKNISFDDYEKSLAKTKLANEILFISVNNREIADGISSDINFSSYIALFFLLLVSINISINQVVKFNRIRNKGILARLKLSGVKEIAVVLNEIFIASLKCTFVILPFILFKTDVKVFVIAILLFYMNLTINLILEKATKSEEALIFVARSVMIIFLALGMFINFYF
ncbi:MAG: ABC transporter permease [Catonella sp.]|uniref:ABC transporter permease n=1 Tax=Catonella sp. TaxID=2382125 RepID=UPI003FA02483